MTPAGSSHIRRKSPRDNSSTITNQRRCFQATVFDCPDVRIVRFHCLERAYELQSHADWHSRGAACNDNRIRHRGVYDDERRWLALHNYSQRLERCNHCGAFSSWRCGDNRAGLTAALLRALLADSIYVNIHTAANPSGEIRGQVIAKAGSGATARYTGLAEVPPVTTTASATASLVATPTGLNYEITVNGLSGPITGAHFHQAGIGVNGPVVRDITSTFAGNRAIGTWGVNDVTQPFTEALRAALVAGQIYLNIHTSANPGGEVRGQCLIDAGAGYRASLTSQQEDPH